MWVVFMGLVCEFKAMGVGENCDVCLGWCVSLGYVGLELGLVSMKGRGLVKWRDVLGSTCERSGLHVKRRCGLPLEKSVHEGMVGVNLMEGGMRVSRE